MVCSYTSKYSVHKTTALHFTYNFKTCSFQHKFNFSRNIFCNYCTKIICSHISTTARTSSTYPPLSGTHLHIHHCQVLIDISTTARYSSTYPPLSGTHLHIHHCQILIYISTIARYSSTYPPLPSTHLHIHHCQVLIYISTTARYSSTYPPLPDTHIHHCQVLIYIAELTSQDIQENCIYFNGEG